MLAAATRLSEGALHALCRVFILQPELLAHVCIS